MDIQERINKLMEQKEFAEEFSKAHIAKTGVKQNEENASEDVD